MNSYEKKQQARKQRYEQLAQANNYASESHFQNASKISKGWEFGQPILVGHHSEKKHRREIDKMSKQMDKSVEAMKKAEYYTQKAESVGKGGISSDDPDAVKKLNEQLSELQKQQEFMKAFNKMQACKNADKQETLKQELLAQYDDVFIKKVLDIKYTSKKFESYTLSNLSANIRRIIKRIEQLESNSSYQSKEIDKGDYIIFQDVLTNRVGFKFDGKPSKEVFETLKAHAFKWSPSNQAWQRQWTNSALSAINKIVSSWG